MNTEISLTFRAHDLGQIVHEGPTMPMSHGDGEIIHEPLVLVGDVASTFVSPIGSHAVGDRIGWTTPSTMAFWADGDDSVPRRECR